jgi:hypothetical protein
MLPRIEVRQRETLIPESLEGIGHVATKSQGRGDPGALAPVRSGAIIDRVKKDKSFAKQGRSSKPSWCERRPWTMKIRKRKQAVLKPPAKERGPSAKSKKGKSEYTPSRQFSRTKQSSGTSDMVQQLKPRMLKARSFQN